VISPGLVSGLAGKRILVTRAREQAEKTAALVRARGGEPVLLPSIELHPPKDPAAVEDALSRAATFAWVAFTSENGVEWTWKVIEGMKPSPGAGIFGEAKLAAIGPSTAAAMEKRGLRPDVVAAESKGEGLAAAVLAAMAPGESLLLLRAQVARDAFPDALVGAGHPVEVVAVYETRPASGPEVTRIVAELEGGAIDAVTFTSASTVESFVAMVGGEEKARGLLFRTIVGSIGPITSEALAAHGLRVDVTPAETTLEALLGALAARFGPTPP
jgi:uroporphyrinogen III methyltransferase / synthase